jgi:uncharacterized protein YndB with AHSA1/START domain
MNILLIILGIIVAVLVVFLVAALFAKKSYSLEREIVIKQPRQAVFDYLKYLKNSDKFNKWAMADPQMRKAYRGVDGTSGSAYAWDSDNKKVGKGEQEITGIVDGEHINYEIRFIKPFEGTANAYHIIESLPGNQSKVRWGFSSRMKYPMNIMLVLFNLEGMLAKDLEISLGNMKKILEENVPQLAK